MGRREGSWGPCVHQMHGFSRADGAFERMQCVCVCVTGTAGLSAPPESENAPLSKTVSQKLLPASEQSSELNGGTSPVDTIVSLNVYFLC